MPEYKIKIEKTIRTNGDICGKCDMLKILQTRIGTKGDCALFKESLEMNGMRLECKRSEECKGKYK